MQTIFRYLVNNRINILANEAGFVTEYMPVYQRQVKVYKGIDNILQFKLLNSDQKPIDVSLYTPMMVAFNQNKDMIFEKECTTLDDGSSASRGLFQVTISESDMYDLDNQFITYNIYLIDQNNTRMITYSNSHFENSGVIHLSDQAYPDVKESVSVTVFTQVDLTENQNNYWVSEITEIPPEQNSGYAVHTAAVYSSDYSGNVTIQATLENQVTNSTNWADITTITLNNEQEPVPVTFMGSFRYVRFKTDTDPAEKISKILIRT